MNLVLVIITALSGAVGGVVGAIASAIISPLLSFGRDSIRRFLSLVVPLLGIAVGVHFLTPIATPYLQEPVGSLVAQLQGDTSEIDDQVLASAPSQPERPPQAEIDTAIENGLAQLDDPLLTAVMTKEPGRLDNARQRFEGAYIRGGEEAVRNEALQIKLEIGTVSIPYYLARAQASDLVDAVSELSATIKALSASDPETCHLWLYGAMIGKSFDYGRFATALGDEQYNKLQSTLASAVSGAEEYVPEFNEGEAYAVLNTVGQELTAQLGEDKIGLITSAQSPESISDSKIACDATATLYDKALSAPNAADVLRYMFMSNGSF